MSKKLSKIWRIELNKQGSVVSCKEVESIRKGTNRVLYMEAMNPTEACSAAEIYWKNESERKAELLRRQRAKQDEAGLCSYWRCKSSPMPGMRMCLKHHHAALGRGERHLKRKRGELPPLDRASPEQQVAKKRSRALANLHKRGGAWSGIARGLLSKLEELCPGEAIAFRDYLISEINKRSAPEFHVQPGIVMLRSNPRTIRKRKEWFDSAISNSADNT